MYRLPILPGYFFIVINKEDYKSVWQSVLSNLSQRIKHSDFLTWFPQSAIIDLKEANLIIGTSTSFRYETLQRQYREVVLVEVQKVVPGIKEITFEIDGSLHEKDERVVSLKKLMPEEKKKQESGEIELIEGITTKILNPKYTLDNFVVGPDNQLAHAAAVAVSRKPGEAYNPLFVYGGVGLGKTHLLQAVGNEIHKRSNRRKIIYATSERFTNEVIEAIRSRKTEKLREKYRQVDVLMIDDIQFLANKEQTQVEFFHTFNTLYESKKQIIISSDRPPKDLDSLEPRLRSRFEWGMMVDIGFPDFETRVAILQTKCQEKEIIIASDVLSFIASNVTESVRELEGVLNQAIALYELKHITPTVKNVAPMVKKLHPKTALVGTGEDSGKKVISTVDDIVVEVAGHYKLLPEDIMGESRRADISLARQISMYIAKRYFKMTHQFIGEQIGKRQHTTAMHACEKIERELEKDRQLKRDINALLHDMGVI